MEQYSSAPRNSSNSLQLLRELEALSASLYGSPATATYKASCLELPMGKSGRGPGDDATLRAPELRPRRASFSYWRSGLKKLVDDNDASGSKRPGLFSFWKSMRALSRIGKQKVSCLFCVEVAAVQGLPASMNGQHLVVCVRKKDSKSGVVRTLPSKVSRGSAEFEETLFVTCHVYFSLGSGTTRVNFEPRPFVMYALAFDGARELECGRSYVDLSKLIQESIEKSFDDTPIREWDTSINMWGEAEGGKVTLKVRFQIMEKDGIGTYIRGRQNAALIIKNGERSPSFARRQTKTSFSVPTGGGAMKMMPASKTTIMLTEDIPVEYEVVDKGVEVEEIICKKMAVPNEVVVKEVMDHHHNHNVNKLRFRMAVLDSIAQQIKELESILGDKDDHYWDKREEEEEMITREFIEMLHDEEEEDSVEEGNNQNGNCWLAELGDGLGCVVQTGNEGFLASINPLRRHIPGYKRVQNVAHAVGAKREAPRLAMQMSKPLVLPHSHTQMNWKGIELFQSMAGLGLEEMTSLLSTLMPMEELVGKTAEQIAFEGIASQIIHGRRRRNMEMNTSPTSSTAFMRRLAVVKSMANAMNNKGDKSEERCATAADVLGVSMRKLEEVTVEVLKIQAGIAEEEEALPPFENVSSSCDKGRVATLFERAVSLQEWLMLRGNGNEDENMDICFVVQMRDPLRRYEVVGGPMVVLIQAVTNYGGGGGGEEGIRRRLEVGELHVGGIMMSGSSSSSGGGGGGGGGKGNKNNNDTVSWDNNSSISREKERMSAMQWLMGNGLINNNGRCSKGGGGVLIFPHAKKDNNNNNANKNVLWSISSLGRSSIAAAGGSHLGLKPLRNPNVIVH